jgi:hypothetical protein
MGVIGSNIVARPLTIYLYLHICMIPLGRLRTKYELLEKDNVLFLRDTVRPNVLAKKVHL